MRHVLLVVVGVLLLGAGSLRAEGDLLFSDNFATLATGWGKLSDVKSVSNNRMVLELPPDRIHTSLYQGAEFGNVDIRVKLVQEKGESDQSAGLIFWAEDYDNYYVARVQSDGRFLIGRQTRGKWLNPVNDGAVYEQIHAGLGQINELRVVTSGRSAKAFVNAKEVTNFQGFPPAAESRIGFFVESGAEPCAWAFSELSVRQGPTGASVGASSDGTLLRDDFSTADPAWGGVDKIQRMRDKEFLFELAPELMHRTFYQGRLFDDIDIRVKVSEIKGNTDQPAGIIFWSSGSEDYVTFLIQSDGAVFIKRLRKGMSPVVNALDPPKSIRKGLGKVNELRVVTKGKSAQLLINDEKLATYTGFPPDGGSRIGLIAESGNEPCTWAFSSLVVRAAD